MVRGDAALDTLLASFYFNAMMISLQFVLLILAVICLLLSALGVSAPRGNLMAAGLTLWALAVTIGLSR